MPKTTRGSMPMVEWRSLATSHDTLLKAAYEAFEAGDLQEATRQLEMAPAGGGDGDVLGRGLLRGLILRRSARQRDAIEMFTDLAEAHGQTAELLLARSLSHRDLGQRSEARDLLTEAQKIDPALAAAKYYLGVVEQELGNMEVAAAHFATYCNSAEGREHALGHSLYGTALRALGRFEESAQAIQRAIELDPDDIPTRNALVITHYHSGDNVAAVAAGRTALEMKDALATARHKHLALDIQLHRREVPFEASERNRNIIAFSLWGDDPVYTHGAIINAHLAPHVYPSWRCRFYCDDSVPTAITDELRRLGAEIHLIRDTRLLKMKALWRFLVSDDPNADRFLCRDADSRLNVQEAVAVDAWIKSGKPFHVMRDHPYHMEVMLAGMWGGVTRVLPSVRETSKVVAGFSPNRWNDQEFLRDVVWPLIRDDAYVHDSVYGFRGGVDFPNACRLVGKAHVGGAVKSMPPWPNPLWFADEKAKADKKS